MYFVTHSTGLESFSISGLLMRFLLLIFLLLLATFWHDVFTYLNFFLYYDLAFFFNREFEIRRILDIHCVSTAVLFCSMPRTKRTRERIMKNKVITLTCVNMNRISMHLMSFFFSFSRSYRDVYLCFLNNSSSLSLLLLLVSQMFLEDKAHKDLCKAVALLVGWVGRDALKDIWSYFEWIFRECFCTNRGAGQVS